MARTNVKHLRKVHDRCGSRAATARLGALPCPRGGSAKLGRVLTGVDQFLLHVSDYQLGLLFILAIAAAFGVFWVLFLALFILAEERSLS